MPTRIHTARKRVLPFAPVLAPALALALLCLCGAAPAHAENRALILSIANYPDKPLKGPPKDIENASEMARIMGVPQANIMVRHNEELAGQGLITALEEFSALVQDGDQIFIYYSGHGSSYTKRDHSGQCEKALVGQDNTFIPKDEFQNRVRALAKRTSKAFVFVDSCFSGGIVKMTGARSFGIPRAAQQVVPKFIVKNSEDPNAPKDPCQTATNRIPGSRGGDFLQAEREPNFYLLGAASETEVSLDGGEDMGGFASAAMLRCLRDPARADANRDGIVSLDEAKACAQQVVNGWLESNIKQNPKFEFTSMTLTSGHGQGGNKPVVFSAGDTQPLNTPEFLRSLHDGRDGNRMVTLAADKNPVRIGQLLNLTVTSDKAGYLSVLVVGSSGTIYKIFPNDRDQDGRIEAGQHMPVPRRTRWTMPALPPAGDNWFLAVVSDTPDRFSDMGAPAGIYRSLGKTGQSGRGIWEFLCGLFKQNASDQAAASKPEPVQPAQAPPAQQPAQPAPSAQTVQRAPAQAAPGGYGSALLKVVEVE